MRAASVGRGIAAGVVTSALVLHFCAPSQVVHTRLVAESASAPLTRVAIHYAPSADQVALGVWRQLFAALPPSVEVDVEVAQPQDFDRFTHLIAADGHLERFHPVIVGTTITTWSRDRYAALVDDHGNGGILAPPRLESPTPARAGDAKSPWAISRALYQRDPKVADIVFEGGDLAATPSLVFADVNLVARNVGHGAADRASIEREIHSRFAQRLVFLGHALGDVPRHHIMMYMMPIDDHTIAVGDIRAGVALLADTPLELDDVATEAARFDEAAAELTAQGFKVVRVPVLVRAGAGSYVTYTNALFDRRGAQRIIYMPTYKLPALDEAGRRFWESQGFEVHPIDVSAIYHLNGSLGCLVNVLARGA
jgi:hypothetical protein